MILFYLLLVLGAGRCTDDLIFETKTVGQSVTLTCDRRDSLDGRTLFWMRLVSGNLPEFFKGTFAFNYEGDDTTGHITTEQGPGTFLLHIHQAKQSDTAVYCCLEINTLEVKLKNWTFLRIKGPEADVSVITQSVPSHPVRPGDSVTLQCSVLSVSEKTACPEGQEVFWLKAGSDGSPPPVTYVHGNRDGCEQSPEALPPHRCFSSFSKNISSSDAGTYYCAAATCGQMLFGNGTKAEEGFWSIFLVPLGAVVVLSLNVTAVLIYIIRKNKCDYCNNEAAAENVAKGNFKRNEDAWTYSTAVFTVMKSGGRRRAEGAQRERIHAAAKASGSGHMFPQ